MPPAGETAQGRAAGVGYEVSHFARDVVLHEVGRTLIRGWTCRSSATRRYWPIVALHFLTTYLLENIHALARAYVLAHPEEFFQP